MSNPSASLWYEIYPETSALEYEIYRDKGGGSPVKGARKASKPQIIQLVEDGKEPPETSDVDEEKPVISIKHPVRSPLSAYHSTLRSHNEWTCPARKTVKIL